jgi:DNA polymerase I-like protein with 3'-5' exonuclease and polymerase domains
MQEINEKSDEIVFITKRTDHLITDKSIRIVNSTEELHTMMSKALILGYDTETTAISYFEAIHLLDSISDGIQTFVIDRTSITENYLNQYLDKTFIGHNLQYDCRIIEWNYKTRFRNVWDSMIVEQILGRGSGRGNSLEETHIRRLGEPMAEEKSTRSDFPLMNKYSKFTNQHILYSGYDAKCIFPIMEIQKKLVKDLELDFRVEIGNKLVPLLASMSIEGCYLDKDKWLERIQEDKKNRLTYEKQLDTEVKELSKVHTSLRGGKYSRNRQQQELIVKDLFGNVETTSNSNIGNINYSSPKQVLEIFRATNNAYPMKADAKTYVLKPSISDKALEQYLIDNPKNELKAFCTTLIKYAHTIKALSSFGEAFLNEYYRKNTKDKKLKKGYFKNATGKVHTMYSQETTANGRLSSGDSKEEDMKTGVFNSQQINKEIRYRQCFMLSPEEIADDWYMSTCDLSGAELSILAALSGDTKLVKLQREDIHSYLATASFNKIISYILSHMKEERVFEELYELLAVNKIYKSKSYLNGEPLSEEHCVKLTKARVRHAIKYSKIKIDKNKWKDIRDPFKNVVYGSTYGAQASKIASTLNIAKDYAQMVIDAMEYELPVAFGYLKRMSKFGVINGYIKFNNRTNSRHWFKEILDAWSFGREIHFKDRGRVERQCKNLPISGTQADMIKEAMVNIDEYIFINNIEAKFIFQVHDELVIKHKGKEFGKVIQQIMTDTANKYLNGVVEMKATAEILHTWTK